jgi:hypothetical protein
MEVIDYEQIPALGKILIHTRGKAISIAEWTKQWDRLQYLWKLQADAVEFAKPDNNNFDEQKALVVFLGYAIKGKLPEMIKIHRKIMEKDLLELEYVMENVQSYSIDGKETKHEETVRQVGNGQKHGYEFRKVVIEETIKHLQIPHYQKALELFRELNKDKLERFEPIFESFYESYTEE